MHVHEPVPHAVNSFPEVPVLDVSVKHIPVHAHALRVAQIPLDKIHAGIHSVEQRRLITVDRFQNQLHPLLPGVIHHLLQISRQQGPLLPLLPRRSQSADQPQRHLAVQNLRGPDMLHQALLRPFQRLPIIQQCDVLQRPGLAGGNVGTGQAAPVKLRLKSLHVQVPVVGNAHLGGVKPAVPKPVQGLRVLRRGKRRENRVVLDGHR